MEKAKNGKLCLLPKQPASTNDSTHQNVFLKTLDDATHKYSFDHIFFPDATQEEVYQQTGAPILQAVLDGFNGAIIAYGQTGAGKTWTMEGSRSTLGTRGIINRAMDQLFQYANEAKSSVQFEVKVSFVEIYNEHILDLLNPGTSNTKNLKIRGSKVVGTREIFVTSPSEMERILEIGAASRASSATLMNEGSSRSHSLFIVTVVQQNSDTRETITGTLTLVDLAGSEMVKKTAASGKRLEEAKSINKSLSALGNVINALTQKGRGQNSHVPYRDSKLTRLLQNSLGGNSRTALVLACSPSSWNEMETLSTLRFGNRAKQIQNRQVRQVEKSPAEMKKYIQQLEAELVALRKQKNAPEEVNVGGGEGGEGGEGGVGGVGGEGGVSEGDEGDERDEGVEGAEGVEEDEEDEVGTKVEVEATMGAKMKVKVGVQVEAGSDGSDHSESGSDSDNQDNEEKEHTHDNAVTAADQLIPSPSRPGAVERRLTARLEERETILTGLTKRIKTSEEGRNLLLEKITRDSEKMVALMLESDSLRHRCSELEMDASATLRRKAHTADRERAMIACNYREALSANAVLRREVEALEGLAVRYQMELSEARSQNGVGKGMEGVADKETSPQKEMEGSNGIDATTDANVSFRKTFVGGGGGGRSKSASGIAPAPTSTEKTTAPPLTNEPTENNANLIDILLRDHGSLFEDVHVKSRSTFEIPIVICNAGSSLIYFFQLEDFDVSYTLVEKKPASGAANNETSSDLILQESIKMHASDGPTKNLVLQDEAKIVAFIFDNTYSFFRSKKIRFAYAVCDAKQIARARDEAEGNKRQTKQRSSSDSVSRARAASSRASSISSVSSIGSDMDGIDYPLMDSNNSAGGVLKKKRNKKKKKKSSMANIES